MVSAAEPAEPVAHGDSRRPATHDLVAAGLLLATVVLHVVAMIPTYFVGTGSLWSQADQAALYSVLAASWALALGVGLTGPHRTPVAAALAVGVAATELGFRVADLGDALRYGTGTVGSGFWIMEAAWVVGAAAAVAAVIAARARHGVHQPSVPGVDPTVAGGPLPTGQSTGAPSPTGRAGEPASSHAVTSDAAVGTPQDASPQPAAAGAGPVEPGPAGIDPVYGPPVHGHPVEAGPAAATPVGAANTDAHERLAWTLLTGVLAAAVAGAFLPAWDHAVATSTQSGRTLTRSLGNAFSGPWPQVLGTVLSAVALLVVPVVAVRLRRRAVGAAAVGGALLVLASQFVAAVVQVDQPVPAADFGVTPTQAHDLGLQLSLQLTGWFTVDALAAYALFAAVMVWATLRVEESPVFGRHAPQYA